MSTVERIARAICSQWVADNYGWEGDIQKDFIEENWISHKDEAQAALNALADGLEFKADYLTLNGRIIGGVFASQHEGFRYDLFGSLPEKVFGSIEDAKQALMSEARKWLIGD